eukprot:scaffold2239_cov301-Alexandrium_tamarense.AAC.1
MGEGGEGAPAKNSQLSRACFLLSRLRCGPQPSSTPEMQRHQDECWPFAAVPHCSSHCRRPPTTSKYEEKQS